MNEIEAFKREVEENIKSLSEDKKFQEETQTWMALSVAHKYSYNFTWMGRPIIQYPQDIIAMQEIIWEVQPDLIIETGIAHGGSLIFYASMLELLGGDRKVVGIDIDIRQHNRAEIEKHAMYKNMILIEGNSIADDVIQQVVTLTKMKKNVLVALDSYHTHEHVLQELRRYSEFVTEGSYLVVFDTIVEHLSEESCQDRPWKKGNSPYSAVQAFLEENDRFIIDKRITDKNQITVCPSGYLKCVK